MARALAWFLFVFVCAWACYGFHAEVQGVHEDAKAIHSAVQALAK